MLTWNYQYEGCPKHFISVCQQSPTNSLTSSIKEGYIHNDVKSVPSPAVAAKQTFAWQLKF